MTHCFEWLRLCFGGRNILKFSKWMTDTTERQTKQKEKPTPTLLLNEIISFEGLIFNWPEIKWFCFFSVVGKKLNSNKLILQIKKNYLIYKIKYNAINPDYLIHIYSIKGFGVKKYDTNTREKINELLKLTNDWNSLISDDIKCIFRPRKKTELKSDGTVICVRNYRPLFQLLRYCDCNRH